MKKTLAIVSTLLLLFSCNRYPDGPEVSLLTAKTRLTNTWIINTAYENGEEKTADFNTVFAGFTLDIKKDDNYTMSYHPFSVGDYNESGTWEFNDDKTHVIFRKANSSDVHDWRILRLKTKQLWAQFVDSSTTYEVHLVPKN